MCLWGLRSFCNCCEVARLLHLHVRRRAATATVAQILRYALALADVRSFLYARTHAHGLARSRSASSSAMAKSSSVIKWQKHDWEMLSTLAELREDDGGGFGSILGGLAVGPLGGGSGRRCHGDDGDRDHSGNNAESGI